MKRRNVIDLSIPLSNSLPVYPGDPDIKIEELASLPADSANILKLELTTHHGTHLDAPRHLIRGGDSLDQYPPSKFICPAYKIDLTATESGYREGVKKGLRYRREITRADIEPHEEKIKSVSAVIFQTGYGEVIRNGVIDENFPFFAKEAAVHLANLCNLNIVGIDSPSVDEYGKDKAHLVFFSGAAEIILLENIINLEKVPERFLLICLPLNIENTDSSPCRAVAVVD